MSPLFLQLEYNRTFLPLPPDTYGFTTQDRLNYAPYAVNYLLNSAEISYLGDLTFPDGTAMYNERELQHMADVKVVTRAAFSLLWVGGTVTLLTFLYLSTHPQHRNLLQLGLRDGSILTLSLIGVIVILASTAWDIFFTAFHQLFFKSGTWRFAFSDTLIRLFPERFWYDAAITIGLLTSLGALLILFGVWRWRK